MTEIIGGVYTTNETSEGSRGGTEQMALRMVRDIDPDLLERFHIVHSRVRDLPDNGLKRIFVAHDLPSDPEVAWMSDPEQRKRFDKIVFVSNWQMQGYNLVNGVTYNESTVIRNAIEPFDPAEIQKDYIGPTQIIYHTTPHRGLSLLPPVIEELNRHVSTEWHIYSSFGVYGERWLSRNQPYEQVFSELDKFDNVTVHGAQPNGVVRERLKSTHIFAYPSIYPETSCIAAIEALCSGNIVVHPNLAALPETCEHNGFMYDYAEDPSIHINNFINKLYSAIMFVRENTLQAERFSLNSSHHFNTIYNWNTVKHEWERLLNSMLTP